MQSRGDMAASKVFQTVEVGYWVPAACVAMVDRTGFFNGREMWRLWHSSVGAVGGFSEAFFDASVDLEVDFDVDDVVNFEGRILRIFPPFFVFSFVFFPGFFVDFRLFAPLPCAKKLFEGN